MDIWGRIYRDQWENDTHPHVVERDDGRRDVFESAVHYFEAPRSDAEREALQRLEGPALDVAAGAGSYAIYLQNHGLTVTAIDSSPLAVKIAGMRGCLDARVQDLRSFDFGEGTFRSVIVMGNSLGLHQNPLTLRTYLAVLRGLVVTGGSLVCSTIDPLDTDDPSHLRYHERNRERGYPPGLLSVRLRYREEETDWFDLWLPTAEELDGMAADAGWQHADTGSAGAWRVRRFTAA